MPRFSGSEDIYKELVEESPDNWLFGLVAFAIVEEQRIEWMRHHEQHHGRAPENDDIRGWYQQQPENVLLRAKGAAENALQQYSSEVLDLTLEEARKEIERDMIIGEIRNARKFWPQFGVSVAGGLVSALLFAFLLVAIVFLAFNEVSAAQIGGQLRDRYEEGSYAGSE